MQGVDLGRFGGAYGANAVFARLHLAIVFSCVFSFPHVFCSCYSRPGYRFGTFVVETQLFLVFMDFIKNTERAAQNGTGRRARKSRKSPEPFHVMVSEVFFVRESKTHTLFAANPPGTHRFRGSKGRPKTAKNRHAHTNAYMHTDAHASPKHMHFWQRIPPARTDFVGPKERPKTTKNRHAHTNCT